MEGFGESMLVIGRVCTIIPLLLLVTLFMGKRSIGELPVFDFIIIITLGSVAGADIAEPDVRHISIALAILTLGILQRVVSQLSIVFRWFARMVTFEPTVIFYNGTFHVKNLKKIRYSLDNVLHMLREKDIFDLAEIDLAIIEANGRLTVLKKVEQQVVTKQDVNIQTSSSGMSLPVIVEGKIYPDVLSYRNRDEQWLVHELKKKGIASEQVFLATINRQNELQLSLKNNKEPQVPPLHH
ncbi:DUF421 domain-containing protein [Brevibacillus porteri]|uniref:DUF421 domain-containing protein n=1 Tax=Brevibacillus porteri TaxID=2126350 RepID=A0ABX5FN99_9BACL|nr:DUF421 domain-containing protein [Brevibacillus porteri]MED1800254.1 DUF421 domain-containing protein [Brevibacillus porteri]MED2133652.1 DUF421 domain-containing protein [Brevibacillus porteri]MED2747344.1 DUF421 domain-containing protein [Brevibacillus porteri]MED2813209.1 DUF421 domain-containing protein [Brevibacillus porteri]MED2892426.1 DUF421 domain-containing protein [Brevibacillus porteri]